MEAVVASKKREREPHDDSESQVVIAPVHKGKSQKKRKSHEKKCKDLVLLDLPPELLEKILSRIPITTLRQVRSTCKLWNSLSRDWILGKAAASRQQFVRLMTMDYNVCSLRFNLFKDKDKRQGRPWLVKQVAVLDQVEISKVFYCKGSLLCVPKDNASLVVVWNPYLGQTRLITSEEYSPSISVSIDLRGCTTVKRGYLFVGPVYYQRLAHLVDYSLVDEVVGRK
ncbi:hypothetical protein EUTSA_v10023084mg [Eutrema salsugineum]|uniref:F-box domain-containing protein n=1 Tax=Eutrema salsugineum TaxID=72664 RepID=V4LJH9_EUTSA|nr:hypothetical protein EUTSA_v10023084mg [Eutrema salsugineum]